MTQGKGEDIPKREVEAQVIITVFKDGSVDIDYPEGQRKLLPIEVEGITKTVSEQLRDMRIAEQALELFKKKLGQ